MSSELKENKMGTMPMKRLLASISLPLVISMLMQAMYNVVDSLFVSRISENALTAVSLAFPVQNFMIAVGVGTGVGMNAYLSRSLGEKNKHDVDLAANNGIFLAIMNYIVMLILGLLLTNVYYKAQTDIAEIIEGGEAYLQICIVGSFGLFLQLSMERLLQSTGKAFFSMITQLVGAILNIIFDPIFIFGYFGVPAMGVAGAALSTILGQIIAMFIGLILNIKINKEITISPKGFRPNLGAIKRIYSVGIPSIVMQSVSSVMTFGMNNILMVFSSTASCFRCIFQTSKLCYNARSRFKQRHGSGNKLQLRRKKPTKNYSGNKIKHDCRFLHYAYRAYFVPNSSRTDFSSF